MLPRSFVLGCSRDYFNIRGLVDRLVCELR